VRYGAGCVEAPLTRVNSGRWTALRPIC
jgi:hypothetical protein